jgi:hypothetical protein
MRLTTFLPALLLAVGPLTVFAANPRIGVDRDPPNPIIIVSDSFQFGANQFGGGDLSFQNQTGHDWFEMTVTATLPTLEPITCGPGPFVFCTVSDQQTANGFLYSIVFGPSTNVGITNGELFSINLNDDSTDPNGVGSWPVGQDFGARANVSATPEPAAYLLLALGFAGLFTVARYRRRAPLA